MDHEHDQRPGQMNEPPFWRTRYGLGLVVFGSIAGYFLLTEHLAHVVGALPYLLLLACPLMHLFMHHGHGGHGHQHGDQGPQAGSKKPAQPKQWDPS